MIRGTTPTYTFKLKDFDTSIIKKVRITFSQNNAIVLEKHVEDCALEEEAVSVTLSADESLLFHEARDTEVQLFVVDTYGRTHGTEIFYLDVLPCLNEEVFSE